MSGNFMSVVQNHIAGVIPNQKYYMNMSLVLSAYGIMMDIQHTAFFCCLWIPWMLHELQQIPSLTQAEVGLGVSAELQEGTRQWFWRRMALHSVCNIQCAILSRIWC
jgi:hypothetical protein